MARSTRLFEIIQLLRVAKRALTAQSMAEELDVSKRTLYRDIATLQGMRIPIDGEAGTGYVMRSGYDLPPLMFTDEEIEAIAVGMALVGRTGDTALLRAASAVVRRVSEVTNVAHLNGMADVSLFASKWHEIPESNVDLRLLRLSVREQKALAIEYQDGNGHRTERTVLPLSIHYYTDAIVLAAWCELREDYRHFRTDRIEACHPTGDGFSEKGQALRMSWAKLGGFPKCTDFDEQLPT